jgi:hypothetical protein
LEEIILQPSSIGKTNNLPARPARTPDNTVSRSQPVPHAGTRTPAVIPFEIETTPIPVDPMLTTWQATEVLGVSHDRMKKWRHRGQGPQFVRYPDGAVRYRLSALMKFLEDHTVWTEAS